MPDFIVKAGVSHPTKVFAETERQLQDAITATGFTYFQLPMPTQFRLPADAEKLRERLLTVMSLDVQDPDEAALEQRYRGRAISMYDGENINVAGLSYRDPEVSPSDEGAWVQAWVWVPADLEDEE
jgi:hypothetical protein